jgi:hypothetical protein
MGLFDERIFEYADDGTSALGRVQKKRESVSTRTGYFQSCAIAAGQMPTAMK